MKMFKILFCIMMMIFFYGSFVHAQDGQNRSSADGGASFYLEPVWSLQIDPRWKAGEAIGDVEDGITVEFVEFSSDGKLLVTGNGFGEAFVLNVADGSIKHKFTYVTKEEVKRFPKEKVSSISGGLTKAFEVESGAFTVDSRFIVLGGNLIGVKIFDITSNSLAKHIEVEEEVDGLSISPDGRFFAHAAFRSVDVLETGSWNKIHSVKYGPENRKGRVINSVDFTADGKLMVMAGNTGNVQLINTKNWKTIGNGLISNTSSIKSVRFSPDGNFIAAGYGGGEVTVWRTKDMSLINQYSSLNYIEAVHWTSDGKYLLAGGRDDYEGRMMVFSTTDWQMVGNPTVQADGASIEYIDVYDDLIAVAGEDSHVRLYRIITK